MATHPTRPEVRCPNCGDPVIWSAAAVWRPFCSERCRLLDLGAWFSEERGIPDAGPHVAEDSGLLASSVPDVEHGRE